MTKKKNNMRRLARLCGYRELGRIVDKLVREKMIQLSPSSHRES